MLVEEMNKVGHSRRNKGEAREITKWLKENRGKIENYYGSSVEKVVAVITPFIEQKKFIKSQLRELPSILVGTVNSLQGAEREIIIFSSVYDSEFRGRYFFDRGINMLNVAVSRAKDSFLVFGDMRIFSSENDTASGVLARYLRAKEVNNLRFEKKSEL